MTTHSNVSISQVQCFQNYASIGGCLVVSRFCKASVSESLFSNNTSETAGGAIDLGENSDLSMSNSTLVGEFTSSLCRSFLGSLFYSLSNEFV